MAFLCDMNQATTSGRLPALPRRLSRGNYDCPFSGSSFGGLKDSNGSVVPVRHFGWSRSVAIGEGAARVTGGTGIGG